MPCKTIGKRAGEIAHYRLYTSCVVNYRCIKTMVAVGDSLLWAFFMLKSVCPLRHQAQATGNWPSRWQPETSWLVLCVAQLVVCLPSAQKVLPLISSTA